MCSMSQLNLSAGPMARGSHWCSADSTRSLAHRPRRLWASPCWLIDDRALPWRQRQDDADATELPDASRGNVGGHPADEPVGQTLTEGDRTQVVSQVTGGSVIVHITFDKLPAADDTENPGSIIPHLEVGRKSPAGRRPRLACAPGPSSRTSPAPPRRSRVWPRRAAQRGATHPSSQPKRSTMASAIAAGASSWM